MRKSVGWARQGLQSIGWLALLCAVVTAVLAGLAYCWWLAPTWKEISTIEETRQRVSSQNEVVRTTAQIALGVLVLMGLFFTARRVVAAEQTAKAAHRTVEVAQEGQITERFTRAIEQLGNDKIAIRLGGIYALERIAKDSDKDHWQVMEVLTAYVRENSPSDWYPGNIQPLQQILTDIQAILTALGRRNTEHETPEHMLNLRMTDLRGAEMEKADLRGADLRFANLHNVYFKDADLRDVNFFHANLTDAVFDGADLRGANLTVVWNLTQEQVYSAISDERTKLPDDLTGGQSP